MLPIDCIDMSFRDLAKAIYANAEQLCALFDEKRKRIQRNSWTLFFKPYMPLLPEKMKLIKQEIEEAIYKGNYKNHMHAVSARKSKTFFF